MQHSPVMSRGFTLVEILVVVSLLVLISALLFQGFASYSQLQVQRQVTADIARIIQTAKEQSQTLSNNDAYGVSVHATSAQLFAQAATSSPLRTVAIPPSFTVKTDLSDGTSMITFSRRTGLPSTSGSIFLFSELRQATSTITVLPNGLVE